MVFRPSELSEMVSENPEEIIFLFYVIIHSEKGDNRLTKVLEQPRYLTSCSNFFDFGIFSQKQSLDSFDGINEG